MEPKTPTPRIGPADHHARRIYLVLAVLNIVASSLYFDPVYFTWWSFQVSLVLLLTGALDLHTAELCYFCFYDALFVCIGVFTMSVMRSENEDDMLSQIAVEDGLLMYAVQTFAVHYLPFIIAAVALPTETRRDDLEQLTASLAATVSFFSFYLGLHSPEDVYGVPITSVTGFIIAASFLVTATVGLWLDGFR